MMKDGQDLFYPFSYLDEVIEIILNPERSSVSGFSAGELERIEQCFDTEIEKVFATLKAQAFYQGSAQEISSVVGQYSQALKLLLSQAMQNLSRYPEGLRVHDTGENLIILLERLQQQIGTRYRGYTLNPDTTLENDRGRGEQVNFKVLCKLSVDQLALLLKAADDSRLIISRSLSLIFRSIVPFLSTDKIKNISWNSMRKSTYQPERADKEIAIATLEKMIRKIREY